MANINLNISMLNKQYSFRSLNPNDSILYVGTIVGIFPYQIAQQYSPDITSYNNACRLVDSSIPSDPSQIEQYFWFQLSETTGTQNKYIFCPQWVAPGSWVSLNTTAVVTIKVYDTQQNHNLILNALSSQGYPNAEIVSVVLPDSTS
ncbi:MAG: hypothetical protein J6S85_25225 [Methanobrevibacter sp.]|nr:hypothetical protein [Methanobrevibacter sp.]MBQ5473617.1 hypothetical protein [Lachnospiraceae bacterium]